MSEMRIVFMGTPDFAANILESLITNKRNVVAAFSQPDKPVGRHQTLEATPVKCVAEKYNIPIYQPARIRNEEVTETIKKLSPDMIVVAAYGKILPVDILDIPPLGCINVHGSLLPKYRGAAPIQWSVINGDGETGVTIMYMAEGMDTGDMILKRSTKIGENETAGELFERLAPLGAEALEEALLLFDKGEVKIEKQNEAEVTLAPMLSKEMAKISFSKTPTEIHNLVRGMEPWPTAYTFIDGKKLKVHSAVKVDGFTGEAGTLLDPKRFIVGCNGGAVELISVQPEGKGEMSGDDFIRGRHLSAGTVIG